MVILMLILAQLILAVPLLLIAYYKTKDYEHLMAIGATLIPGLGLVMIALGILAVIDIFDSNCGPKGF